jgi:hypothetical protein
MNCAESVVHGFQEECEIPVEMIKEFHSYGGGRAPDGVCGSFYAVTVLLEKMNASDKIEELNQYYIQEAGSVQCKEIRRIKKLDCRGCVEISAKYLDSVLNQGFE